MHRGKLPAAAVVLLLGCQRDDSAGDPTSGSTSSASGDTDASSAVDASGSSTMSSETGESTESTGPAAVCGNEIVEPGEQCDGSEIAGNECPVTCRFPSKFELWAVRIDVHGLADEPADVAVDAQGDVFVAGLTTSGADFSDPLLLRVSDDGTVLWVVADPLARGATESWQGIALTGDAVYVTGAIRPAIMAMVTARYDLGGAPIWSTEYIGPVENAEYKGESIAIRDDGSLLVAGLEYRPGMSPVVLLEYDEDGALSGDSRLNGPIYDAQRELSEVDFVDLALNPVTESPSFAGQAATDTGFIDGWIHAEIDRGEPWDRVADGPGDGDLDQYLALAIDSTGSTVAVGRFQPAPAMGPDIWVHKYDAAGTILWSATYDGGIEDEDRAHGVAIDSEDNIFVHGNTAVTPLDDGHDIDLWLRKYDSAGNQVWTDTWSGEGIAPGVQSWDYASEIAIDPHGLVVVTAKTFSADNDYDVLVRKIAP